MAKKTIAIVGAGPGVGLAIAKRFGRQGFKVALLSRNQTSLNDLVECLSIQGIEAAAFTADVTDDNSVTSALNTAISHFGSIDVLEYSPCPPADTLRTPKTIDVANQLYHLRLTVLGAVAAVQTVLPGMIERKSGSLLFTGPASAQYPVAMTGSACVAAGSELNYAKVLNQELSGDGIYAGFVSICGWVIQKGDENGTHPSGLPLVAAQDVADIHWDLHVKRDRVEAFAGDLAPLLKLANATVAGP
ncbi:SDR family NAD(P)-dependent oxidoreductase [Sphingobium boeckii]|uniref:NADP-dependent 3-hydroxy acid dehydrogenase YdfG n=1 Tax=Sphingobium boeckii TaxID=1082345 RepID=A0A7W9AG09_9SPHN|nr:SDR family oxidoreductase [Sphingobium boeckii]MBB5684837.1 NADP-dependent 3-hydroxy acid dehydrogenase YdfG [Sphingobium boeckii]